VAQAQVPGSSVALPSTVITVTQKDIQQTLPRRMRQPTADQLGPGQFCWGTGRRKSSVARVRIRPGSGKIIVNKHDLPDYFRLLKDQADVRAALKVTENIDKYDVFIKVTGGGTTGQAGAVKLGLARALAAADPKTFDTLGDAGFLTRDSRMVERKKYGYKKARKSFQFSKR